MRRRGSGGGTPTRKAACDRCSLAAFLVGVLLVFGSAGAALALAGRPRRAVAAAGLWITGLALILAAAALSIAVAPPVEG